MTINLAILKTNVVPLHLSSEVILEAGEQLVADSEKAALEASERVILCNAYQSLVVNGRVYSGSPGNVYDLPESDARSLERTTGCS